MLIFLTNSVWHWFLWPDVKIIACASIAELFIQYSAVALAFTTVYSPSMGGLNELFCHFGKTNAFLKKQAV